MYKILSRALNTRLKLARDFIFSRAQKGFTNSRYIQEVLINLCETVGYCNQNNVPACIVAIDQAKAFDTISNSYMLQAYRFFGLGEYMINLLTTLGSGRVACISFDDGSVSDPFDLERGRTQGNGPSPCEYNIGQQILLFKLELCPDLASVYNHLLIPRTIMSTVGATHPSITECIENESNPRFSQESNRETDKAEGFADDTSVATIFSHDNLLKLKNILEEFATISGLRCNLEKTSVLLIGSSQVVTDEIASLGFAFSDSIKVLGMDISRDPEEWDQNFARILAGINKKIEFWNRFNLSLPGRICVTKSLLISPLTHLGCFKLPSRRLLKDLQQAVDKFCKGKINISSARLVTPVDAGGMGLFNIEEFLMAQQCCWVFRCFKSCRDNWRNDLYELSMGNPLSFSPQITDSRRHPVLFDIAVSFERFRTKFDKKNENYLTGGIFFNPILYRKDRDKRTISPDYLCISDNINLTYRFAKIEIQNLCDDYGIRTKIDLANDNLSLTDLGYGRLSNALNCFLDRMARHRDGNESSKSVKDEFCFIKKPGRKCRTVLSTARVGTLGTVSTVKTFFQLIELPYTGDNSFSDNVSWWNMNFLPNRIRMFAFKFYNNILGINTRTSHFATNPTRACTFCSMVPATPPPDETFLHLFFSCPTVSNWHSNFVTRYLNNPQLMNDDQKKSFWFLGLLPRDTIPVPRAQKKETQARANCSAVPTQLALCLRLAIDL
jgi:hypothetical protein